MEWTFAKLILGMIPAFVMLGAIVTKIDAKIGEGGGSVFVEGSYYDSEFSDFGGLSPKIFGGIGGVALGVAAELFGIVYFALLAVTTSIFGVNEFLNWSAMSVLFGVAVALHFSKKFELDIRGSEWYRWG